MRIMQGLLRLAQAACLAAMATTPALAAGGGDPSNACTPKQAPHVERHWSFQGVFGHYDHDSALRGFEVYRQVCAACHALDLFKFRNLAALGATEEEIKGVAAEYQVPAEPNEEGEIVDRTALPSDGFPPPFPNEKAATAAHGAYPPDLSLMLKSREALDNHVAELMSGYIDAPAGCEVPEGKYYNASFPGYTITMEMPLADGKIDYGDGTAATTEQMIQDVTQFLMYVAEPHLEERKQLGLKVILFLVILTALLYLVKRQVWRNVH